MKGITIRQVAVCESPPYINQEFQFNSYIPTYMF